jgi:exonuclease III
MRKIFINVLFSFFVFTTLSCTEFNKQSIDDKSNFYVASWNVENLFDTIDDPDKNDDWFLPDSEIEWTERKLTKKLANLAKVIDYMNNGEGPDILGVQEVENEALLRDIVDNYLKRSNYEIAYSESPDARGIDNGLIYNSSKFGLKSINPLTIKFDEPKSSRDILYVQLVDIRSREIINIFVNHWPSRREGLKETEKFRIRAAKTLFEKVEQLRNDDPSSKIIILGDFNDLPSNISLTETLGASSFVCNEENIDSFLFNLSSKLFMEGKGSYKYRDHWNMLDQIIVSTSLVDKKGLDFDCDSFEIIMPTFIVEKTGKYAGTPLPTFGGRKYLGGFSDHFPVGARFIIK